MKLLKKDLETIYAALSATSVNVADARIRDSLIRALGAEIDQLGKDKSAIYREFCDKSQDGTPEIADGKYHFQNDMLERANAELVTLAAEEVEIPVESPEKIREIAENTAYLPKPGEVEIIDAFVERL